MNLSNAQSKSIAVGLLILSLAILWVVSLSPLVTVLRVEQQLFSQNLERLTRYESLQANATEVAAAVSDINQYVAPVYVGPNASSIFASMQRDIGGLATSSGLNVGSIRPLNNSNVTMEGYLRLILRVDLTGTTHQLADFITATRGHSELLVTMKASLRAIDNGSATRAANVSMGLEIAAFGSVTE